jgi:hypothetical protein
MENYNEEQMREQMRRRQDMFKKMGAPNAGKVLSETAVTSGGNSMAAKMQAIKSGAAKSDFSKYINAKGTNAGAGPEVGAGFNAIPEPKQRKGPKEEVNPEYKQSIEEFSAPRSSGNSELDAINAMFGDMGGSSSRPSQNMGNQNDFQINMDIDSAVMPSFNPQAALQQKARQTNQMMNNQQDSPYLKFAGNAPHQQQEQYMQESNMPMNMQNLQFMMETIAKGIAEKTIRSVLNEYTTQQKGKPQLEYYNKEKGIVQTPDGKLYRLQPVEVRKK